MNVDALPCVVRAIEARDVEGFKGCLLSGVAVKRMHGLVGCGQPVEWDGRGWVVYDANACKGTPGFTLILVSGDLRLIAEGVDPRAVVPFGQAPTYGKGLLVGGGFHPRSLTVTMAKARERTFTLATGINLSL